MLRNSTAFVPRYQKFESISLQQRVTCELDFGCDALCTASSPPCLLHATVLWIGTARSGKLGTQRARMGQSTQDNGRFVMPLFITQGRFTREYIRGGMAKPEDRYAVISRLIEQAGGKLVSLYITLGQYDFLVVSEMPDAKAASILAFVATGGGGIEGSVTTQAFTTAEARDMLEAAGKLAGSYKPMGAS